MKSLTHFALVILLFCSCRKVDQLEVPGKVVSEQQRSSSVQPIQNLGHVFSGTNVAWKLHPLDFNKTPLFTSLPNQTDGYSLLMIDNGVMDGLTPINAFRFVSVNMKDKTSKIISVTGQDGHPVKYSLGRIVCTTFGMDKKYYVATQASGHLIQYDPLTQKATDLGQPFKKGNTTLAISILNVGSDGALYGGSFGGEGDAKTFRFDYKHFEVDATALDNTSRFVTSVSGDSRYTYAVGGKNNYILYAIDRQTGEKRVLKNNVGGAVPIQIASNSDAPYAQAGATHYRLSGFSSMALKEYDRPVTSRVSYVPFSEVDTNVPQVYWSEAEKKVMYKLKNGETGSVTVNGLQEDIYPTSGPMTYLNNKLYLACYKQGLLGTYAQGEGFKKIGSTSMGIQSMGVAPSTSPDAGKIFLAGYPKGGLLQFSPVNDWTVNVGAFTNSASTSGFATTSTNPKQSALFQNADGNGTVGSMSVLGIEYTKNGYIASAGNNDRITASSGRELSMGSYRNGAVRNLYLPEFSKYSFQSMCLTKDSNYALISAIPHSGKTQRLYKYDPSANRVVAFWDIALWDDMLSNLVVLDNDILFGFCSESVFLFDMKTGQIIWKETLGRGEKIYSATVAPDNSVYVNHMFRTAVSFKIMKYNFNLADHSKITTNKTTVTEFTDQDNNERTKPTGMVVVPTVVAGNYDLYVSGLNSLYRIKV